MTNIIKAVIALSIGVIVFGSVYLVSKDSSGTPNIMKIVMKGSQVMMEKQMEKMKNGDTDSAIFKNMPESQDFEETDDIQNNNPQQQISLRPQDIKALTEQMQNAHSNPDMYTQDPQKAAEAMKALEALAKYNQGLMAGVKQQEHILDQQQDMLTPKADMQESSLPSGVQLEAAPVKQNGPLKSVEDMNSDELVSALMLAVSSNDVGKATKLLSNGANPNTSDNATSATPLFTAIANNNPQMVQLLLDHGADVTQVNEKGSLPLHEAASGNAFAGDSKYRANEMIQSLIEHGADVNQKNAKGQTALMLACKSARKETVIFLLNKNASTSIQDAKGKTVGDYASEVPAKDCFDILRKYTKDTL